MHSRRHHPWAPLLLASWGLACFPAAPGRAAPPAVEVSQPVRRDVTDAEEFTGRLTPSHMVELRARVTGYLDKVDFKDGSEVKQGDVLFEIDPRPYQAALDLAKAKIKEAEATLKLAKAVYQADMAANAAVSKQQIAQDFEAVEQAEATLKVAEVAAEVAQLNLAFTRVTAPIGGRISRPDLDPGNLVLADTTRLGVLVATDPMYVSFDVDERTLLRIRADIRAGTTGQDGKIPLEMGLANEEGFPRQGQFSAFDLKVDAATGTIRAWGVFPNADGFLLPGLSARVRMPLGKPHAALLVPDAAVLSDQDEKYLLVVDDKNRVRRTPVKVGALHDGLREIQEGLTPDSWVVVAGAPRVKDGDEVEVRRKDRN